MAKSHAPPLQINQYFAYLRDHLLLGKNADIHGNYRTIFQDVNERHFQPVSHEWSSIGVVLSASPDVDLRIRWRGQGGAPARLLVKEGER